MKRIRKFCAIVMVVVLVFAFGTCTALATTTKNVTLDANYNVVVGNGLCTSKNVTITCYNTNTLHHNDVRMLDSSGNVVWEEYGAIDTNGTRTFWCGSNVYSVEVRIGAKNILGNIAPRVGSCNVTF